MSVDLRHGDCLDIMREIPDGSVDMVLCDLPYGTTQCAWDSVIPFAPLWENWHRVCKKNAAVVLFSQMPFTAKLALSNEKEFRYEWIWQKTNASGFLNAKKMPMKAHDNILVFYRMLPTYNPQFTQGKAYKKLSGNNNYPQYGEGLSKVIIDNDGRRYPEDVIRFSNPSWGGDKGSHPTQKPIALLEYLIRTYTNEGETVLDNTMGSGSTGVACVNTGRNFIGIEKDDRYFEIARNRIDEAVKDMETRLF